MKRLKILECETGSVNLAIKAEYYGFGRSQVNSPLVLLSPYPIIEEEALLPAVFGILEGFTCTAQV